MNQAFAAFTISATIRMSERTSPSHAGTHVLTFTGVERFSIRRTGVVKRVCIGSFCRINRATHRYCLPVVMPVDARKAGANRLFVARNDNSAAPPPLPLAIFYRKVDTAKSSATMCGRSNKAVLRGGFSFLGRSFSKCCTRPPVFAVDDLVPRGRLSTTGHSPPDHPESPRTRSPRRRSRSVHSVLGRFARLGHGPIGPLR